MMDSRHIITSKERIVQNSTITTATSTSAAVTTTATTVVEDTDHRRHRPSTGLRRNDSSSTDHNSGSNGTGDTMTRSQASSHPSPPPSPISPRSASTPSSSPSSPSSCTGTSAAACPPRCHLPLPPPRQIKASLSSSSSSSSSSWRFSPPSVLSLLPHRLHDHRQQQQCHENHDVLHQHHLKDHHSSSSTSSSVSSSSTSTRCTVLFVLLAASFGLFVVQVWHAQREQQRLDRRDRDAERSFESRHPLVRRDDIHDDGPRGSSSSSFDGHDSDSDRREGTTWYGMSLGGLSSAFGRPSSRQRQQQDDEGSKQRQQQRHKTPKYQDKSHPRIISFGSASTWGAGLGTDVTKNAYPFRVANAYGTAPRNVATRDRRQNAVLPAACTQSIVGDDEVYDAVTVEFEYGTFDDSYRILALRLRERFPRASITFVRLWYPHDLVYTYEHNHTSVDMLTWKEVTCPELSIHSNEFTMAVLQSGPEHWSIIGGSHTAENVVGGGTTAAAADAHGSESKVNHSDDADRDDGHRDRVRRSERLLRQTMIEINAGMVAQPIPTSVDFQFPLNLHSYLTFFQEGYPHYLSKEGHVIIANGLHQILNNYAMAEASSSPNNNGDTSPGEAKDSIDYLETLLAKSDDVRDSVGSWGTGDQCNLWYYNGQYNDSTLRSSSSSSTTAQATRDRQRGRRLVTFAHASSVAETTVSAVTGGTDADGNRRLRGDAAHQYPKSEEEQYRHHKHALEFRKDEGGGSITVYNPFKDDRLLYLTYMTASDEEDRKIYPRTRVLLNGKPSVVIEPYHEDPRDEDESSRKDEGEDDPFDDHHLTRTSAVGVVSPGETVVQLDPLDDGTQLHFRLVGASILSEEATSALPSGGIDFTLESEPAHVPMQQPQPPPQQQKRSDNVKGHQASSSYSPASAQLFF